MSAQKAQVQLFYDAIWNRVDKARIPDVFRRDFIFGGSLGPVLRGHDEFAAYVDAGTGGLPDFFCEILELTEEENRVVANMRFSGTHNGDFMGFAPTGSRVEWAGSAHLPLRTARCATCGCSATCTD